jgi:hypothetical protein
MVLVDRPILNDFRSMRELIERIVGDSVDECASAKTAEMP